MTRTRKEPGSGRGRKAYNALGQVRRVTLTLDEPTIETMQLLGSGEVSRGIRIAARKIEEDRKRAKT